MDGWPYPCMSDPGGRDRVAFYNIYSSSEIFALHSFRAMPGWSFGVHDHPLFEMNYLLEGQQRLVCGDSLLLLGPGDILLVPPGMSHSAVAGDEGFTCLCFGFDIDLPLYRENLIRTNTLHYPKEAALSVKLREGLDRLYAATITQGVYPVQQLRMSALLHAVFADLAETLFAENRIESPVTPAMRRMAEVMAEEIHRLVRETARSDMERIHLEDITKKACVSLSHCSRIFQKVYGMPPRAYLSMLRQREAKNLLLLPELPISEVARRIGYANDSDFSRQFKRWTGQSPKVFRLEACRHFAPSE